MQPNVLKNNLEQFIGTENYYRLTLFSLLATDGVKYFVDNANAYWLINDIAAEILNLKEDFILVTATGSNNKAKVIYSDGNYTKLKEVDYNYSDLPEGEWKFFVTDNVIMLPSEY